jgi:hypothetical protein
VGKFVASSARRRREASAFTTMPVNLLELRCCFKNWNIIKEIKKQFDTVQKKAKIKTNQATGGKESDINLILTLLCH